MRAGPQLAFPEAFARAFARVLADGARDPAFAAEALALPSESYSPSRWTWSIRTPSTRVRIALRRHLARALRGELLAAYQAFAVPGPYSPDARAAGQRALSNLCLGYLMELDARRPRWRCACTSSTRPTT